MKDSNHVRADADRKVWAAETLHAMERLETGQRNVLVAVYRDGHSHAQIADDLHLPETTVATSIARAMQYLAAQLMAGQRSPR